MVKKSKPENNHNSAFPQCTWLAAALALPGVVLSTRLRRSGHPAPVKKNRQMHKRDLLGWLRSGWLNQVYVHLNNYDDTSIIHGLDANYT